VECNRVSETKLMAISFYIVDLLDRGFDGFADGSQFRVDNLDFGPFVCPFCIPRCAAAENVDGINLCHAMNLGYDVST
jgi:hypothetical protein